MQDNYIWIQQYISESTLWNFWIVKNVILGTLDVSVCPRLMCIYVGACVLSLHELSMFVLLYREWAIYTLKALFTKTWSQRTFFMIPIKWWSLTSGCLGSLELFRRGGKKHHLRGSKTRPQLKCCSHCTTITWGGPVICNNCWSPQ